MHRLGGADGLAFGRREFFVYSKKDRKALKGVWRRGYKFPEITPLDTRQHEGLQACQDLGIQETGYSDELFGLSYFQKDEPHPRKCDGSSILRWARRSHSHRAMPPAGSFRGHHPPDIYGFGGFPCVYALNGAWLGGKHTD
jgi:hypothetical protein